MDRGLVPWRPVDESVRKFQAANDANIFYLDDRQIIAPGDGHTMPDELHPDAEGIKLMGERFLQRIFRSISPTAGRFCEVQ